MNVDLEADIPLFGSRLAEDVPDLRFLLIEFLKVVNERFHREHRDLLALDLVGLDDLDLRLEVSVLGGILLLLLVLLEEDRQLFIHREIQIYFISL